MSDVREKIAEYRSAGRKKVFVSLVIVALIFVICIYSLSVSRLDISFTQALEIVWNHLTDNVPTKEGNYSAWWTDQVVMNDNAPRTICGVCVGAILAVSGAIMQSITRNPLTDPYTIGISSAALLGMSVALVTGACVIPALSGTSAQVANAFTFSLLPVAIIALVTAKRKCSPTSMILIGIAMMYMFNAFTTFLKYNASAEEIHEIYEWSLGTLTAVSWDAVYLLIATFILLLICAIILADKINIISAGDNEAISLGENPNRVRVVCFLIVSVSTSVCVCFTGSIGFVGLVGPHVARLFVGSNNKILIPASALVGSFLLVGADVLVRSLPNVLPVGVVTSLIGSPLFLYFLYAQRRKNIW